jgi:hypothetical protein
MAIDNPGRYVSNPNYGKNEASFFGFVDVRAPFRILCGRQGQRQGFLQKLFFHKLCRL